MKKRISNVEESKKVRSWHSATLLQEVKKLPPIPGSPVRALQSASLSQNNGLLDLRLRERLNKPEVINREFDVYPARLTRVHGEG